jgi:hypothetical protein
VANAGGRDFTSMLPVPVLHVVPRQNVF